jgi:4,5-DOPA dioxygenase extradiol
MTLNPSPRLPVLFIGHGSPMNAIEDNAWRRTWQDLGAELLAHARPQLILCISAHWLTQGGAYLTGMAQPRTIHDFGGFPRELYEVQYPAPGAPAVAQALAAELGLGVDDTEWGLDHGAWGVLQPMFPAADIPVVQLSMDYARPPAEHFALGQKLRGLRERGVLIVGSGNVVHNLRMMRMGTGINAAYDWAQAFDQQVTELVKAGRLAELARFQQWGDTAQLAHPTYEHFLPLLYAAGAAEPDEAARFFNTGFQAASTSMRSMLWGA